MRISNRFGETSVIYEGIHFFPCSIKDEKISIVFKTHKWYEDTVKIQYVENLQEIIEYYNNHIK